MAGQARKAQKDRGRVQRRHYSESANQENPRFGQPRKASSRFGAENRADSKRPSLPIVGCILWGG